MPFNVEKVINLLFTICLYRTATGVIRPQSLILVFFAPPTIWDSLPEAMRNHDDISKFKTALMTVLFKQRFN